MEKPAIYKKIFSRDFSLISLQIWYEKEVFAKRPWSGQKQIFLPYLVFKRQDGTVESFYDPRGVEWVKNDIKKAAKKDKEFFNKLKEQVDEKLESIRSICEKEPALSKNDLLGLIKNFRKIYPWIEAMWWLGNMSGEELKGTGISPIEIKKLVEKNTRLSAGMDAVTKKSLAKIFPKMKEFVHVLAFKEIMEVNFPSIAELKSRDKGFIFVENRLYPDKKIGDLEKKYGILLERERINKNISKIKGDAVYPGVVRGKVRLVMGHQQFDSMKKGEILVSPMTMPDFLPAIKKAKAIVTDEGGLLCHAAIVARELRIPCVTGTKIATKILKDGQLVEVDAKKGIIKIIH